MEKILDLHIHSKYSRACSKELELPKIARACEIKGIDICVTGDFTHPAWFKHIKENLIEDSGGVYKLRDNSSKTRFIIGTEIASIKKHNGQTRRLHLLVFAPNIEVAEKFNKKINDRGINLKADGRPILGMTAKDILELMLEIDSRMVMIPAHAWTPWFGVFGSKGGYDSLDDCFEDLTAHIFAIETGLSSDPLMNRRLSILDDITLVSNSDAHSLPKLGREANVLNFKNKNSISYSEIMRIIREKNKNEFLYTIEFYPEEGKYHLDGHRDCNFVCEPEESKSLNNICPKCNKQLVIGVCNRVLALATRNKKEALKLNKIPYKSVVPLDVILSDMLKVGVGTKKVKDYYNKLINSLGGEFFVLLNASFEQIKKVSDKKVAETIIKAREGDIFISPGYDGKFGIVKIN
ncbi:MAG: hypothetical protein A2725_01660 [Candidatus Magasanikbacteria bacterium RIFCSPHIGHO2_01_FULL_33_34]|uniref:DNA helicase UvrD n=1 Tax=Candidatus Magasanikbacteria bacterium RIFCSPHIGHO2_01_FULL_33_34 TaxID=1798671 RepID=A0A1F6LJD7_9BACT|nr:MAG: hypothetical protein A2725_01660 [Candidatus Magasanikbacteria bacterium RIFCSPHIGHO2_01_FULL_33_34]OGH65517.1 MAG: hypothetical protein A3B83_01415 [Candidatus Magasanikbacteria bacterium RIFCSPHIGHO2_02_FULL_33_17]OGH76227.1 MAG: hypothetical protein A3A89_02235 [Candidatus Magasanikbacteria bacterium RIFCSPLOWO2_01_FULL_33_34]OGH81633.1 MAG: hypothetical protein A3F93_03630 [Candidatus Magasanikbacteria bacterium RIFCSPLOWO2_12_FULL_34_7]